MGGFTQFFLNPALVPVGTALVASPIIIHLINRMRFRKVRFAAMEFLLQAQQRNRRRLLMEQLLLLLLRILIVLAIMALIARLILDPRMSLFGGEATTHHLVVLDDSASMQTRSAAAGEGDGDEDEEQRRTSFDDAKETIRKLVEAAAGQEQQPEFSLVLLSRPNDFLFDHERVSEQLVRDLKDKLSALKPTARRPDLQVGLETARQHLERDEAVIKHLHLVSDFRRDDWRNKETLGDIMSQMHEDGVTINLVRSIDESAPNAGITTLSANLQNAAKGVPIDVQVGVTNFGTKPLKNVTVTFFVDGDKLPLSMKLQEIKPGEEIVRPQSLTFQTAGFHRVRAELVDDSLSVDNTRFLSLNIPERNNVLIVTTDPDGLGAFALTIGLENNAELTGILARTIGVSALQDENLKDYRAVYMLNVPSVPEEALPNLKSYVYAGGGLVWFLGGTIKVDDYNILSEIAANEVGVLVRPEDSLFPVLLGDTPNSLTRDRTTKDPDWSFVDHPIFNDTLGKRNPIPTLVMVNEYMPVSDDWNRDDQKRDDGVQTLGETRDGFPIAFEHRAGDGVVVTMLTSPGPPWTNLHTLPPIFPPWIQQLQQYVAKSKEVNRSLAAGDVVELEFPEADYKQTIEIYLPDSASPLTFSMDEVEVEPAKVEAAADDEGGNPEGPVAEDIEKQKLWKIAFKDTSQPGVYQYKVTPKLDKTLPSEGAFAHNVPPKEGVVEIASDEEIVKYLAEEAEITIHKQSDSDVVGEGQDLDREVRNYVMIGLLLLLLAEQALAYKLSYHPEPAEAVA